MQCPVQETLFIYITKDPYSWLSSLAAAVAPTGVARKSLISRVGKGRWTEDGERYKTALLMRKDKMRANSKVGGLAGVEHFKIVRYEDFLDLAVPSLSDLLLQYRVPQNSHFTGVYHDTSSTREREGGGEREGRGKKFRDHVGKPFTKFKHYADREYLK